VPHRKSQTVAATLGKAEAVGGDQTLGVKPRAAAVFIADRDVQSLTDKALLR
jgi:hypothetical protein